MSHPSHLYRAPGQPRFLPALHGLRGIAALAVLMFHWSHYFVDANLKIAQWQWPGHPWVNPTLPFALGSEGVFLFYVLSGFLLTRLLQGKQHLDQPTVIRFYARRLLRIYPAVWLQLVVLVGVSWVWADWTMSPLTQDLLPQLLLWINLPPNFDLPVNGVWWTLPVELMFYAVLPALVLAMHRFGIGVVLLMAVIITIAWRVGVMAWMDVDDFGSSVYRLDTMPGVLSTFVAGMCTAQWLRTPWPVRRARTVLAIGAVGFIACNVVLVRNIETYWQGGGLLVLGNTLLSLSLALIVAGICAQGRRNFLSGPLMQWMGERSFGLYLWHVPAMQGLLLVDPSLKSQIVASLTLVLLLSAVLAELSYRLIERPVVRWAHQRFASP